MVGINRKSRNKEKLTENLAYDNDGISNHWGKKDELFNKWC